MQPVSRNNICLLCCFLPVRAEVRAWMEALNEGLIRNGLQLVILASEVYDSPALPVLRMPHTLKEIAAWSIPPLTPRSSSWSAHRLAERDRAWVGERECDLQPFLNGYATCEAVLDRLLAVLRPALVLTWGSSLPPSVLLREMCEAREVPSLVLERGLLPGTLMTDVLGHGSRSDLNTTILGSCLHTIADDGSFRAAQTYYRGQRRSKYAQADPLSADEFQQKFNPDGRAVLAFFGQYDHGSGLYPTDSLGARNESPLFETTFDCLAALAELFEGATDRRLLFKPHPLDTADYSALAHPTATISREVNLHDLLAHADVNAFMLSTTQFEALLYEKPCVLLAKSALAGRRAAYEPRSRAELARVISAAFQREGFESQASAQRGFISGILSHYLFRTGPAGPARMGLAELADFLVRNASPSCTNVDLDCVVAHLLSLMPMLDETGLNQRKLADSAGKGISEAWASARLGVASKPENPESWDALGECMWQAHAQEEASEAFRKAASIAPRDPHRWSKLGMAYRLIARLDASDAALVQALKLAPGDETILHELAVTRMLRGRFAEGLALLSLIQNDAPGALQRELMMARCRFEIGDVDGALQGYRDVLVTNPNNQDAQECIRTITRMHAGEGSALISRTLASDDWLRTFRHVTRAEVHLAKGRYSDASTELLPVLGSLRTSPRGLRLWARTAAGLNQTEVAFATWQQVLSLDPADEEAKQIMKAGLRE